MRSIQEARASSDTAGSKKAAEKRTKRNAKYNFHTRLDKDKDLMRDVARILSLQKGQQMKGCQSSPTPSAKDPICEAFLAAMGDEFHSWPDVDEVEIRSKSNLTRATKCYRPSDEEGLGWCGVNLKESMKGRFNEMRTQCCS